MQGILGHASPDTTLRYCGHLTGTEHLRAAMDHYEQPLTAGVRLPGAPWGRQDRRNQRRATSRRAENPSNSNGLSMGPPRGFEPRACAGVGVATVYRRFPTRPELIAGAFGCKITAYADVIDDALADEDPWRGFCTPVERMCEMQSDDHCFADVLTLTFPMAPEFQSERDRGYGNMVKLIKRAKAAGALRKDFVHEDIPILLMANAGVITATGDAAPDAWRRLVAYLLQAFSAQATQELPAPPSPEQTYRAMQRLSPTTDLT